MIVLSWCHLLVIRVIDDECKFSFWYIEASAYYVCNCVYLFHTLEQQIELVLMFLLALVIVYTQLHLKR